MHERFFLGAERKDGGIRDGELDSTHEETQVDRKVYFVKDGTAGVVGHGAQSVLLAVKHIATKLSDPKSPVREASHWYTKFEAVMMALGTAVAFADDVCVDRQSLTPEVEAARPAWLNEYVAAKSLLESVLRNLGRIEQMLLYFYDLRVPAGTKVTAPPADEPETTPGPRRQTGRARAEKSGDRGVWWRRRRSSWGGGAEGVDARDPRR